MSLYLTRNLRKDSDYVNGMRCSVIDWEPISKAIIVETDTQRRLTLSLSRDDDLEKEYFPVRPGYASTVMKFQGAELAHVIFYLDRPHVPAPAYPATSRVRRMKDCLVGGNVTPDHFTPAR